MRDRIPTLPRNILITPSAESGIAPFEAVWDYADLPTVEGTPLNKANLLSDEVGALVAEGISDPNLNDAWLGGAACKYAHSKTGTVHAFTGSGRIMRIVPQATNAAGDTATVNGNAVTLQTLDGTAPAAGLLKVGVPILAVYDESAGAVTLQVVNPMPSGVYLPLAGGTMTGTLTAATTNVTGYVVRNNDIRNSSGTSVSRRGTYDVEV